MQPYVSEDLLELKRKSSCVQLQTYLQDVVNKQRDVNDKIQARTKYNPPSYSTDCVEFKDYVDKVNSKPKMDCKSPQVNYTESFINEYTNQLSNPPIQISYKNPQVSKIETKKVDGNVNYILS
jgi:hypothetical protein